MGRVVSEHMLKTLPRMSVAVRPHILHRHLVALFILSVHSDALAPILRQEGYELVHV